MQEYFVLESEGLYEFQDLFATYENGNISYNSLTHQYNEAASFIIKAVVFSYVDIEYDGKTYFYPLRWKGESVKLFMGVDNAQIEDFSELGGGDFVTIPWPHLAPIIGGTDENSKYKISIRNTLSFFIKTW